MQVRATYMRNNLVGTREQFAATIFAFRKLLFLKALLHSSSFKVRWFTVYATKL
jgi:hypothetical protein